jgi:hypothetical protein
VTIHFQNTQEEKVSFIIDLLTEYDSKSFISKTKQAIDLPTVNV